MRKILLSTFILLLLFSCVRKDKSFKGLGEQEIKLPVTNNLAKENTENMDTIYQHQHQHLTLLSTRIANSSKIEWKTVLMDKNKNELLLDSVTIERAPDWEETLNTYGYNQLGYYTISTSYLHKKNLFIIYQNAGKIFISKYIFEEDGRFKKEDKFIKTHSQTPYIEQNEVISTILSANNQLYINIQSKKSRLGKEQSLYKIDMNSFFVNKIEFNGGYKTINPYQLSEFGKDKYTYRKRSIENYNAMSAQQKKENESLAPTEREIKYVKIVEQYLDKPYYYKKMSANKDEYYEEHLNFEEFGLESFRLFSKMDSNDESLCPLDENKIRKAKTYLKEVLNNFGKEEVTQQFKLLGHIYQSKEEYNIFFFYRNGSLHTEIAIYNNYHNEWHLGNYVEEAL